LVLPTGSTSSFWKDTSGNFIYSQSGNIIKVGGTYYWYGDKYHGAVTYAANPSSLNSDFTLDSVVCHSSTDLVHWKLEWDVFLRSNVPNAATSDWFGRMGVAYNVATQKYVLLMHYIPASGSTILFATSSTPAGPFTLDHLQTSLTNVVNNAAGDMSVFVDDDGQAYLIFSSSNGRANLYVGQLQPADFLNVQPATRIFGGPGREGNCMFKYSGNYYFCSSDLHGWNASHTYCISASNINGPYSAEFVLDGTDPDFSHVTQTGFFISVQGTAQTTIIYAGDRWSDFAGNGLGFNQWVPLTFTGTTPHFQSLSQWSLNAATGTWAVGPGNNYVLNPSFEAERVAVTQTVGWTMTSGSNVLGGHTGRWSWQLTGTSTLDQKIATLPNGTYTLSAWVKSSASGAQLYAKGFGGTDKTTAIASASAWTSVSIPGIVVSNGTCDIGITGSGQTVTVDDFWLSQN
jgi:hypothetical protein